MNTSKLIKGISVSEKRNNEFLHLTANENQLSKTANRFLSSKLSERYFFGGGSDGIVDFGTFLALGSKEIQDLIDKAKEAAKEMLHCVDVNFNPLSGVHAMMSTLLAISDPGDTVMIIHKDHGGHFATKSILERTGRKYVYAPFNVEALDFEIEKIGSVFKNNKCKAIYIDISYYVKPLNIRALRKALGREAIIVYDASHTVGLMMGGEFQSPLTEGADIISANTHKTLPGPQKGLIAFRSKELAEKVEAVISGGLVSSPHTHHLIALSIAILEMKKYGKKYARQVIKNSNKLGEELERLGYEVRKISAGVYSNTHQVHLYIDRLGDRMVLYKNLIRNNISTNFDNPLGNRLFIRLGTQEVTRLGMLTHEMETIASFLDKSLRGENIRKAVINFKSKYRKIHYSSDLV